MNLLSKYYKLFAPTWLFVILKTLIVHKKFSDSNNSPAGRPQIGTPNDDND